MQKTNKMFGVTLLQMNVTDRKHDNVTNAMRLIRMTVEKDRSKMVVLPEMFTTPHGRRDLFEQNAELIPTGETCMMLSNIAKELKIYIVAGLPERDERDKSIWYNTIVVFKNTGDFLVKHRQVHLVDMDLMDMKMKESDFLTAGNTLTTFDMDGVKIGLGICCDLFYSEMATLYRKFVSKRVPVVGPIVHLFAKKNIDEGTTGDRLLVHVPRLLYPPELLKKKVNLNSFQLGCDMMIYTTAYPKMIGEMFTDMLTKTRAADNQMFVMTISQARMDERMMDMVYGHSLIVDGYGKVLKRLNDREDLLYLDIDLTDLEKYRRDIKLLDHKRTDIYDLVYKK